MAVCVKRTAHKMIDTNWTLKHLCWTLLVIIAVCSVQRVAGRQTFIMGKKCVPGFIRGGTIYFSLMTKSSSSFNFNCDPYKMF